MTLNDTLWRDNADAILPDLIELRRAIHREPELGLQNPKTLAKIKDALAGLPLEFREGPSTTGLLAVLCLAFGLVASVLYARRLVRPILDLRGVVQRVAGGDLSVRASGEGGGELGSLAARLT